MKKSRKGITRLILAAGVMTAFLLSLSCGFLSVLAAQEDAQDTAISGLLTAYMPEISTTTNVQSGFQHPGVGVTKELLDNVQTMVRAEQEPWKSYFEDMLASSAASATPTVKMTDPANTAFNSQGTNSKFISDALTAYTQAVLYYVTGDNIYRKNALDIIRLYEQLNPDTYVYFNDACIHTGIPMNRMCIAAEIIRYSSYQLTDGYTDADLEWTQEDTEGFINNLVEPVIETFQSSPDHFMNQHLYTVIGAMSGYLFMDDAEGYAKTVEWFTVNKDAKDQGFNGSIKRLFREIYTIDEVGQSEGSGSLLDTPVIQHVEMGRDQAHGCGDLTNAAILSRLMLGQGTKVDPVEGTVSSEEDAVGIYEFLDDRILKAADFFFQYMLGYDTEWVQVPFAITEDGIIKDNYTAFSPSYRGRYLTINFWDLYTYYTYKRTDIDLETQYPYFYEGFMKKMPPNYYWNGNLGINWDNVDGGGDFWIYLPAQAAGDSRLLAEEQSDYLIEAEDRGSLAANKDSMLICEEDGVEYVRFLASSAESKLAITSGGTANQTIAFRIRTDGIARLSLSNGVSGSVYLPDTGGEWEYVTYTREASEGFGDLYYVILSEFAGTYVDIDAIDIKPSESNGFRTIEIVNFESGSNDFSLVTYTGASFSMLFDAVSSGEDRTVSYSGFCLPDGVSVDALTGQVSWTPAAVGTYTFYVSAKDDLTTVLKKITVTVTNDREAAIMQAISDYDETQVYISNSLESFQNAWDEVNAVKETASDSEFSALLNELCTAVTELEPVSCVIEDDPLTEEATLDYTKMIYSSTMGSEVYNWTDGNSGTFVGYYNAVNKAHIIDFGPDFKISAIRFGYQARLGFSDRLAGVQVFGSNDKESWTRLTVGEAPFTQAFSIVDVAEEYRNERYRYLMIKKTTEYSDVLSDSKNNLLEFGEFRIWGTRYEVGNEIESIQMTSESSISGRVKMGDYVSLTIQTKHPVQNVTAVIQGLSAAVTQISENTWIASAVMQSGCTTGDIEITVDYTKQDGTAGDTFYQTTDDSSLFLVNSDIHIDVALVAAELTASSPSWDGKATAEECAAFLFDGDVDTFGDLKNAQGEYYTVDFGEGVAVLLEEVMLMPRSTAQNHADRLNGTVISGSNDGENWIQITPEVSGAVMGQWIQISGSSLLDSQAYRYFMISGATQGDIAEVEFYGSYLAEPSILAERITGIASPMRGTDILPMPVLPKGYEVTVYSSSEPEIVAPGTGIITTPDYDTLVEIRLQVTRTGDNTQAVTDSFTVLVYGLNESPEIDIFNTAGVSASCGQWGGGSSAEEIGYLLFDKEADTFGDLQDSDGYYIIDFGGNMSVLPVAFRILPRSGGSNGNQYVSRLNGTVIYGSDDGESWTAITRALSGASEYRYYEIGAEDFVNYRTCRYLKIAGSSNGNIAELEVYGVYQTSAEALAEAITSVEAVGAFETAVTLPWVPAGYEITIHSSSNTEIIALDGSVTIPDDSEQVILTFEITGFGEQAVTGNIPVTVQGIGNLTFDVKTPAVGITVLGLPEVPEGFELSVYESSDTNIIALDGSITIPQKDTLVDITLRLGRKTGELVEVLPQQRLLIYGAVCHTAITISDKAAITATNDPYDSSHTKESIAALLVDGDISTFGDLKGTGGAYIIDFGENASVILDKVRLYPRNTKADHIARLNGTFVAGSNDGVNWEIITDAVVNAEDAWYEISAEDFLTYGQYRYFKLAGGTGGNIAEVEFYGVYTAADPQETVSGNN